MKTFITCITFCVIFFQISSAQKKQNLKLNADFINNQLSASAEQYKFLVSEVSPGKFPKTFAGGSQEFSNSSWWCSGFYPGTLLYLSEGTSNSELEKVALEKLKDLEKEQYNKGTHDLGFMLFCSFGNALRLTNDSVKYQPILKTGAESLISRYSPITKTIRSWDHNVWKFPVIIDNMMNLEFLMEVSKTTGDKKYADIAITHANTTMKNHFRKDFSSYHVIDYNPEVGGVLAKQTAQGAFDESSWARGQAWGLYGFTMMYRETKDKSYLKQSQEIADFILNNEHLPEDLIPYWDFDKDKIPANDKTYSRKDLRDASAAAVIASALLELSQYTKGNKGAYYLTKAEDIIKTLSSKEYFAQKGENGGYLLKHSVGALPLNSEVDVPLTYADYYYVESLVRYRRILEGDPIIKR